MQTQLKCPDGSRPRILFAEDSDTVRLITAALLRRMGCDVDAVVHGEEAVKSASAKNPTAPKVVPAASCRVMGPDRIAPTTQPSAGACTARTDTSKKSRLRLAR